MFQIVQSNDTYKLASLLAQQYQSERGVFDEFLVITPAKVLDEWLKKVFAKQFGITVLFFTQFWGQYQWQLIGNVLKAVNADKKVPEVAVLSQSVICWRVFDELTKKLDNEQPYFLHLLNDEHHPLQPLLIKIGETDQHGQLAINLKKLWRLCQEIARLYVKYLTQRPDWLDLWTEGRVLDVEKLIAKKDELSAYFYRTEEMTDEELAEELPPTANWQIEQYQAIESALRWIWHRLFANAYRFRHELEMDFWMALDRHKVSPNPALKSILPKTLYLFTVQQLPPIELQFLKKLSKHFDIILYHYNPSMLFWGDIVDKNWLLTQKIVRPSSVYLKDYGHGLLSRLGKASRDTFAMLAHLSGGDDFEDYQVEWQDKFVSPLSNKTAPSLLTQLKHDILMLDESGVENQLGSGWADNLANKVKTTGQFVIEETDDSLVVHNCHSLHRQLEIARMQIGKWLNADPTRQLSDIAIMLPDVERHHALIKTVFGTQLGLDGLYLPAKITGVSNGQVQALWHAIERLCALPASRFYAEQVFEWILLPSVYKNFGLTFEQASRACELLTQAGFVRGLNAKQVSASLDEQDTDFRHCFAFALDSLVASLAFGLADGQTVGVFYPFDWQGNFGERTALVAGLGGEDEPIVLALCQMYAGFCECLGWHEKVDEVSKWLDQLERTIIDRYFFAFRHSEPMRAIFDAKNQLQKSLIAIQHYEHYHTKTPRQQELHGKPPIRLPFSLVLESLGEKVLEQQISAEPSGLILVGRFGALRTLPFRLVIMLGMNLSEFPRQEPKARLDLMKADTQKWGDRISEEDDNGAFLEALLSAGDNCWIFYDGQTPDGKVKLPATPVTELLNFIGSHSGRAVDEQKTWVETVFVRKHPPLPFSPSLFEYQEHLPVPTTPPAPIWHQVYHALKSPQWSFQFLPIYDKQFLKQLKEGIHEGLTSGESMTLSHIIAVHKNFAQAFLRDKIATHLLETLSGKNEPLSLDSLDNYQLGANLLADGYGEGADETTFKAAYFANLHRLPAGVGRFGVLTQTQEKMMRLRFELLHNLAILFGCEVKMAAQLLSFKTQSYVIHLPVGNLSAQLPMVSESNTSLPTCLVNIRPSTEQSYHLLSAFLHHLAYQLIGQTTTNGGYHKYSFWQFFAKHNASKGEKKHDKTICYVFSPIEKDKAIQSLATFWRLAQLSTQTPILLTPTLALEYQKQLAAGECDFEKLLANNWHKNDGEYAGFEGLNDAYWYNLFGDGNDELSERVADTLMTLSPMLYGQLLDYLWVLEDGHLVKYLDKIRPKVSKETGEKISKSKK